MVTHSLHLRAEEFTGLVNCRDRLIYIYIFILTICQVDLRTFFAPAFPFISTAYSFHFHVLCVPVCRRMGNNSPFSPTFDMPDRSSSEKTDVSGSEQEQSSEHEEIPVEPLRKEVESPRKERDRKKKHRSKERSRGRDRSRKTRRSAKDREKKKSRDKEKSKDRKEKKREKSRAASEVHGDRGDKQPITPPRHKPNSPQPGPAETAHPEPMQAKGKDRGKGKRKVKCSICRQKISVNPASQDQHKWLSEYCLSWQAWYATPKAERDKDPDGCWEQSKQKAAELKATREYVRGRKAARETIGRRCLCRVQRGSETLDAVSLNTPRLRRQLRRSNASNMTRAPLKVPASHVRGAAGQSPDPVAAALLGPMVTSAALDDTTSSST